MVNRTPLNIGAFNYKSCKFTTCCSFAAICCFGRGCLLLICDGVVAGGGLWRQILSLTFSLKLPLEAIHHDFNAHIMAPPQEKHFKRKIVHVKSHHANCRICCWSSASALSWRKFIFRDPIRNVFQSVSVWKMQHCSVLCTAAPFHAHFTCKCASSGIA